MSSIIHCQNMLFLVGLKFNNLTDSVNTSLCRASVLQGLVQERELVLSRGLGEMGSICFGRRGAVSPG